MPTLDEILGKQPQTQEGLTLEQILATSPPAPANPMRDAASAIQGAATTPVTTPAAARMNADTGVLPNLGGIAGTLMGGPVGYVVGTGLGQAGKEAFREHYDLPPDTSLTGTALQNLSKGKIGASRTLSVLGNTADAALLDRAARGIGWVSSKLANVMGRRVTDALEQPDTKEFLATMAKMGENPTLGEIENIGFLRSLQDLAEKGGKEVAVERNKRLFGKFWKELSTTMDSIAPQMYAGERGIQIRQTVEQARKNFADNVGAKTLGKFKDQADAAGVKVDIGPVVYDKLAEILGEGKGIKLLSETARKESENKAVQVMQELRQNAPVAASLLMPSTGGKLSMTPAQFKALASAKGLEVPWSEAQYLSHVMGRWTAKTDPGLSETASAFYGPIREQMDKAAVKGGFADAWRAATNEYREGIDLFDKRLLPAILAKDPEKLITALGRDSGAQWDRLKQGLLQYGQQEGQTAWRSAQRQWMESLFMDPVKGKSFSNLTQMADELASYSPEVKRSLMTDLKGNIDPQTKVAFDNVQRLADAAQRFRYLNPKGAKEGLYNLNAELMGQAQVAMGASANVMSGKSLGLGTIVNGVAKLGPTWVATHVLMNPQASDKLLTAIRILSKAGSNPKLTTEVHSLVQQAVRLGLKGNAIREAYAAGAEDVSHAGGEHPQVAQPTP